MDSFWKRLRNSLTIRLLPYIGFCVVKVLAWTMRFEERGEEGITQLEKEGRPFVAAFWHGRMLMMPVSPYRKNARVMISRHRDGELISRIIGIFGLESIRGSTTKGGVQVLKEGIKAIEDGYKVVITPDGPKGPRFRFQIGSIELASATGAPIIPIAFSCTRKKVFSSWDSFILPYPFSKGVFFYGAPFWVSRELTKEEKESKRKELEQRMRQMTRTVDRYCETGQWEEEK